MCICVFIGVCRGAAATAAHTAVLRAPTPGTSSTHRSACWTTSVQWRYVSLYSLVCMYTYMQSIYKHIYVYTCIIYTCSYTHPYSVLEVQPVLSGHANDQQPWVRCADRQLHGVAARLQVRGAVHGVRLVHTSAHVCNAVCLHVCKNWCMSMCVYSSHKYNVRV